MYNDENPNGYTEEPNSNGYDQSSNDNNQSSSDYNQSTNNYNQSSDNYNQGSNDYNQNFNNYNQEPNKKKRKNNNSLIISVVVAVAAVLLVGAFVVAAFLNDDISSKSLDSFISENSANTDSADDKSKDNAKYEDIGSTDTSNTQGTSNGSVVVTDVSNVVDSAMPSVVAITSTTLVEAGYDYFDNFWDDYFGGNRRNNNNQQYEEEAAGSGIILDQTDTELLIVTNNHVVEGSDSLKIQFHGEEKSNIDAYIKGTDPNADVAVVAVKLKDIPKDVLSNIKKATIGDSDQVKVGEGVVAIGNALGYGQSVTTGVISAKDREVTIDKKTMTLLQTDAAINGGNSGGALLNSKGEVIGINVAKYSSSGSSTSASVEGMGFAIPISSVKNIISNLETRETRTKASDEERGYLGITGNDVQDDVREQYGVPQGAYIYDVTKGGPADKAGIMSQDVVTKFDGQTVSSYSDLQSLMAYYKAGEKVKVTIAYRSGRTYEEKDVTVTLADEATINSLSGKNTEN